MTAVASEFTWIITCCSEELPTALSFISGNDAIRSLSVCNDAGEQGGTVIRAGTGQGSPWKRGELFFLRLPLPVLPAWAGEP